MSSLIFYTDEQQALIASDTLAVSTSGEPFMFTSKVFIIPHLRMIIAGTGAGGFIGKWFIKVNDRMIVRDIDHLDYHTSKNLNLLWDEYKKEYLPSDNLTATVYCFGFSNDDGLIHSYAYRSTNDFESETLKYGVSVKPECRVPENFVFPADIPKMMDEQRHIQAQYPENERVYIGGEILIYHLTQAGLTIHSQSQFEDFTNTERAIYENFDLAKDRN